MFKTSIISLAATAFFAISTSAFAEESIGILRKAEISNRLFELGVETGDVLLIVAGAKLRQSLAIGIVDQTSDDGFLNWQVMLNKAKELAGEDEVYQALIADVELSSSRGIVNGPLYSIAVIRANGNDIYETPFEGGKYAEIYVEGAGDADLNVLIHDTQGRLVCSDTDISHIAYCGWRPANSADFRVTVQNKDGAESQYSLMTN